MQRPNTPVPGALNAVPPTNFYGTPTLPTRSNTLGSSHTAYIPPGDPPAYASSPGFREPELIPDEPLPDFTPSNAQTWPEKAPYPDPSWDGADWDGYTDNITSVNAWAPENMRFDPMDYMSTAKSLVDIDGRDELEEKNWWDTTLVLRNQRPGPGMLPPILAEDLHDPDHSLFSVIVTPPEIHVPIPAPPPAPLNDLPLTAPPTQAAWTSPASVPAPMASAVPLTSASASPPPPTEDDVRTAVPHPNAYYCPKENGWVILSWKSSSVPLPLAKSFQHSDRHPLPSQSRRRHTHTCISAEAANKTHHFHKYDKAVDSHKLTPPFHLEEWESIQSVKQRRRTATILKEIDIVKFNPEDIDMLDEGEEDEGKLLDLYICCQCSFYCVSSSLLSGVIPRKCFEEFVRDKRTNPTVGKTGEQAIFMAFETLSTSVTASKLSF